MQHWQIDELKHNTICYECVGDTYLSDEIQNSGKRRKCRYCERTRRGFTLEEIADRIEGAFDDHYTRTATDMNGFEWAMHKDPEIDYSWEREGEPTIYAIMNAADIPEQAASDIQSILGDRHDDFESAAMGEETPFSEDAHYEQISPDDRDWQEGWRAFENAIKTQARFFSRTSAQQLAGLFDDIDQLRTYDGTALIEEAGPETGLTHLYRARVFQSDAKLQKALERPDLELAAPPLGTASAGRMNAQGISTFYGATEAEIALAEVRPPVGSQVAVARFEITRPLRLLNLNALEKVHESGSIFDPQYAYRLSRMMFLRSLTARISRPVMPDDQASEYLPTQAVADYLATEGKVPLDGILFPSVQAGGGGLNAVLFFKASRCEELIIPYGTKLSSSTAQQYEEGWEREYTVIEEVPASKAESQETETDGAFSILDWDTAPSVTDEYREPTLRIDIKSVEVHVVEAANFTTTSHKVRRSRRKASQHDF